ncbi:V-type ATPase subunit [Feifania hominis]|uniref:V-type ATPase subunit n=1 Tax=Feifania hominis TaxID=2763660 RepID=A0A926HUY8_9FIRM|nr:V-type ATPase subunit [Feifania hominis]MBC8536061.1 V-type ATPase subunit [Feifania hominis]
MRKLNDSAYLYASGKIKVLENALLTSEDVEKLIDARSNDEILKILADHGYDSRDIDPAEAHFYDELIENARSDVYEFIQSIAPSVENFHIFLYPTDYHNLKVAVKSEIGGAEKSFYMKGGSVPVKALVHAVRERDFGALTRPMAEGVEQAFEQFERSGDPQEIDIILDNHCFLDMKRLALRSGSDYLKSYVDTVVDVSNIKSFFRLRRMNATRVFAARVMQVGGLIAPERLASLYDAGVEAFVRALEGGAYGELVSQGAKLLGEPGGMAALEQYCDDFQMRTVRRARRIPFGEEVLAGYLLAKETEFKMIRIIMAGRRAGLGYEEIKGRLRLLYV